MVSTSTGIIITLVILVVGSLLIWLAIEMSKKREDDEERNTFLNFQAHNSNNRAYGKVLKVERTVKDDYIVTYQPADVIPKNYAKEKLAPAKALVAKRNFVSFPKGQWSAEKNIDVGLPDSADELDPAWKEHPFGKMLMFFIELENANAAEIDALKEAVRRQQAHIREHATGEVSEERVESLITYFDKMLKAMVDVKKQGKEPNFGNFSDKPGS